MKIAAAVLALVVIVAVIAVVAMPRDVTVVKEGEGTLSFEGDKSLRAFGSIDIDIEPADGYRAVVYLDGDETASDVTSYKYSAPFADFSKHEVKVVFERVAPAPSEKVSLIVEANEGGKVDPAGTTEYSKGTTVAISIEAEKGYVIDDVKVDGVSVKISNTIDVKMDADRKVSVSFVKEDETHHTVSISANARVEVKTTGGEIDFGSVIPSGIVKVKPGSSLKISVVLKDGFEVEDFVVDGKSVGKATTYTIEDIRKSMDVSISVVQNVDGFVIKASAGNGGKITPSGDVKVEKGKDATFKFDANSGYAVKEVTVDGKKVTASGSYTFKAVSENHTIAVTFKYVGSGSSGGSSGGSVTPSKTLTKIEVTKQPSKTTYWKDETFNASGMEVKATYSDGSTRALSASEYSTSPSTMDEDTTKVTVSYGGKTCDVQVTVKYVTNLTIERIDEKDWYKVGETVTKDVLKVIAEISNGTKETVDDYTIAPSGPLSKDDNLSVTYRGYTKTVIIDIYEFTSITADTEKKTYLVGDDFDKDSITVMAIYKNCKGTGEQTETVKDFTIDPEKSGDAGTCPVTVTYQGKECNLTLTIVDSTSINSIKVSGPTKTKYFDDTKLDTAGLVITGTNSSGAEINIPVNDDVTFDEGKADKDGKVVVTVTYNEKKASFEIFRTYDIHDLPDLKQFRDNVNDGKLYNNEVINLTANIDMENEDWTPIGYELDDNSKRFSGTFNGNGNTIKNLHIEWTYGDDAVGLFGGIQGTVKNLIVDGAFVKKTGDISTGDHANGTAVVVGTLYDYLKPNNCIQDVTVKNATVEGCKFVGAVVGYASGSITSCNVENIILKAAPIKRSDGQYYGGDKVGGIVGYINPIDEITISKCSVSKADITAYCYLAGIAGYCAKPISECTLTGRVLVTVDANINYKNFTTPDQFSAENYCGNVNENVTDCIGEADVWKPKEIKNVTTTDSLREILTKLTSSGAGNNAIIIEDDIVLNGNWTPVEIDGYNGAGIVTIYGNGHTITGLNAPLLAGGFAGKSGVIIKDLTLKDVNINDSTSTQGLGAFISCIDSMERIELINCHLVDSVIKSTAGARVGGLIGWTAGYNNPNDGPVDTYVTLKNCSVKNTKITANGSVGGLIGHAGSNAATYHTIENCTVTNCTLTSTDNGDWRVGVAVGTCNVGEVTINKLTSSGNNLSQTGKTAPEGQKDVYGRFVPNSTGKLTIDGESIILKT